MRTPSLDKSPAPLATECGASCRAILWIAAACRAILWIAAAFMLALCGCTTAAAKKALEKPQGAEPYAGFDPEASDASKRKAEKPKPVKDDTDPEEAVNTLVKQLQRPEPEYAATAEETLKLWGLKQGVDKLIVSKVRMLLKDPKVEVRAPALRLTILYGGLDCCGDLIEALADSEYGIRAAAFKSLRVRTHR
ncbi:MAG: hypothetical protein ABSE73_15090, partial [Planctomycetota bacterium]